MGNYYKALVIVPLLVLAGLGGLYFYLTYSVDVSRVDTPQATTQVQGGAVVETGTKSVSGGSTFDHIESGYIYYLDGGLMTTAKVPGDEMVISCTDQQLEGATELDFDEIRSIIIVTPEEVNTIIDKGTSVIVFSDEVDGEQVSHTIAVSDFSLCED